MENNRFVSRGGIKLQAALDKFKVDVKGKVVLDVGSSTGGFVDCLIQNRAKKVYALDTSYGELAWKLRNDPRVVVMERINILYLDKLPEEMNLITIDCGWTKLELVLPKVKMFLKKDGQIVALLKPQYETDKNNLVKGIVPAELVESIKNEVIERVKGLGYRVKNQMESPILGGGGNKEYLLLINN